jgi:hypothetical protein
MEDVAGFIDLPWLGESLRRYRFRRRFVSRVTRMFVVLHTDACEVARTQRVPRIV